MIDTNARCSARLIGTNRCGVLDSLTRLTPEERRSAQSMALHLLELRLLADDRGRCATEALIGTFGNSVGGLVGPPADGGRAVLVDRSEKEPTGHRAVLEKGGALLRSNHRIGLLPESVPGQSRGHETGGEYRCRQPRDPSQNQQGAGGELNAAVDTDELYWVVRRPQHFGKRPGHIFCLRGLRLWVPHGIHSSSKEDRGDGRAGDRSGHGHVFELPEKNPAQTSEVSDRRSR